ncbi:predicted protein [Coccidioides posadasii C735 delta SOWgp]|uniref:Uncharacterized protein n=1 Tax=Coccidioides posadasii (strain C735) TaxID=222929 RepID=C5PEX4_COCP7|nr:predicted protein [Coccidioides posadasii C735 delta SOWgp]EER23192.1 predicted protein [Coccidioides posadasii C735 delta SOWgp]|eukprot:XP_003065337.1 predicted protein [Coccidioides posadasii C735 delta SOWgp]
MIDSLKRGKASGFFQWRDLWSQTRISLKLRLCACVGDSRRDNSRGRLTPKPNASVNDNKKTLGLARALPDPENESNDLTHHSPHVSRGGDLPASARIQTP